MNKKILVSLIVVIGAGVYYFSGPATNKIDGLNIDKAKTESSLEKNNSINSKKPKAKSEKLVEDKKDVAHNHNTIHDEKLKIQDLIVAIEKNEKTESLQSMLTQFSTIDLENVSLKELKNKFDKIDIETELTVDRNDSTGNMFFLKSKSNIPGTRYLHGQIVGEGPKKFIQHLSFEYKSDSKSFNEAITVAQSLIGSDQKPSVISPNYVQWKISETHILWVKNLTKEELLDDPIYPHTEDDLGTSKIAIEQEIH